MKKISLTLAAIALFLGLRYIPLQKDSRANNIVYSAENIIVNKTEQAVNLLFTPEFITYQIIGGDTLSKIARRYGMTIEKICDYNPEINNPDLIIAGRRIKIPSVKEVTTSGLDGKIRKNTQNLQLNMSEFTTGLLTSGNSEHAQEPLNRQDATKVMSQVHSSAVLDTSLDLDGDKISDMHFLKDSDTRAGYMKYLLQNSQGSGLRNAVISIIESRTRQYDGLEQLVTSPSNAVGIFQLTPNAIKYLNQCTGRKSDRILTGYKSIDGEKMPIYEGVLEGSYSWNKVCSNPMENMRAGIGYLNILEHIFCDYNGKDKEELIVAAYNCGFPQVKNAIRGARAAGKSSPERIEEYSEFLSSSAQIETVDYVRKYREMLANINSREQVIIH